MKRYLPLLLAFSILASACGGTTDAVVSVTRDTSYTGRGNESEKLLDVTVSSDAACRIMSVDVTLDGSEDNVSALRLVSGDRTVSRARVRKGKKEYRLRCATSVRYRATVSVCADIRMSAAEGDKVSADVRTVRIDGCSITPEAPMKGGREILLCRKCLYKPGDFGYYWTAEINTELPYMAWDFYFQSEYAGCFSGGRDNGRSIRPVRD